VVLVRCKGKLLLVYNQKWRAFTFPMTKLPAWDFVDVAKIGDAERRDISDAALQAQWRDAAAHSVVECWGQPSAPVPLLEGPIEVEYTEVDVSWRDGADRVYRYKLFTLATSEPFASRTQPFAWMTADEIRAGQHHPMSPTVLKILGR
jgi:hypothetical protein